MSEFLGKFEKPLASQYEGKRILYMVPLLFSSESAPQEFKDMFAKYWQDVADNLESLQKSTRPILHVFHEAMSDTTEQDLKSLERLNSGTYPIIKGLLEDGAQLEALEDKELVLATTDWERFMMIGIASQKVADLASKKYVENTQKRYKEMSKNINEKIGAEESAVLFLRETQLLQLDNDIEKFNIAPPILDDINKWLRVRASAQYDGTHEDSAQNS